jgi:hypothetical protein
MKKVNNPLNLTKITTWIILLIPTISQTKWLFSFAPFTEGWWIVYSRSILAGKMPYRDFELLSTPLYPYLVSIFTSIFGEEFYKFRLLGLILQFLINLLLFLILKNYTKSTYAALISTISTLFLQNSNAFMNYDYNYVAILFVLVSLYYLVCKQGIGNDLNIYISGLFLGLSFLVKQTFGLNVLILYVLISVIFLRSKNIYQLATGFIIPNVAVYLYFTYYKSNQIYLESIFKGASGSKGGLEKLIFGWIPRVFVNPEAFANFSFISISFCILLFMLFKIKQINIFLLISLVVIYILRFDSINRLVFENAYKLIWLAPGLWLTYKTLATLVRHKEEQTLKLWIFSLGLFLASMLSAGLSEIGSFMPLAVSLVYITNKFKNTYLKYILLSITLISFIVNIDMIKSNNPYTWWNYRVDSSKEKNVRVPSGLQVNLLMTEDQYVKRNSILDLLPESRECQNFIQFPHMPYFQLEKGCENFGYFNLYWPDFTSESSLKYVQQNINSTQVILLNLGNGSAFETQSKWFNAQNNNYIGQIETLLLNKIKENKSFSYDIYFDDNDLRFFVFKVD